MNYSKFLLLEIFQTVPHLFQPYNIYITLVHIQVNSFMFYHIISLSPATDVPDEDLPKGDPCELV